MLFGAELGGSGPGAGPGVILPLAFALGLALVHLFAGRMRFLDVVPRSRWLSLAGGVSIAYVFVHLLPEVQEHGRVLARTVGSLTRFEHLVYLVALLGFVAFYGLEQYVRRAGGGRRAGSDADVFWIHVGTFAAYNALVGYLLVHRETAGVASLVTYAVAMALHFVVNDVGLRDHHGRAYRRRGRWVLAAAVVVGFAVGVAVEVGELVVAVLFSFLAGGVILNVIKEELPADRESRFWAFAAGVGGYTAVLLFV